MSRASCSCQKNSHQPKLLVVTGGPGGGKTAILEMAKRQFCHHIAVLPEAASIIFGGGFWRLSDPSSIRSAQRAIYHVQKEMESIVNEQPQIALALCDRGTLDGLAYWPDKENEFWKQVGSTKKQELARYIAVIHLHPPKASNGYKKNKLRTESAKEAARIDRRICEAWSGHPQIHYIDSTIGFMEKAGKALELIYQFVPHCCRK